MAIAFTFPTNGKISTPPASKPLVCHPKSTCAECLPPAAPKDTFTPSESSPMNMADPSKYPDKKPATDGRIGTPLKRPFFFPGPNGL